MAMLGLIGGPLIIISGTAVREPDSDLRAMLRQVDPRRIQATILRLTQFGTRHTASSQTDPVRGIGAATAWVFAQMQAIAATSSALDIAKDNLQFGLRAVDTAGNRSPVAFPTTVTT